ncbi:hypothetical protein PAHAL_1G438900 [Panicum hallii]|uniref:Uncharacterized protein n=1 Tax=Panicum hallii TaxID=206008 RepID=A0A2T8KYA4_9POAL|nr:hypothetical protein PAHAL_1G438900 [Panicum hallii]
MPAIIQALFCGGHWPGGSLHLHAVCRFLLMSRFAEKGPKRGQLAPSEIQHGTMFLQGRNEISTLLGSRR